MKSPISKSPRALSISLSRLSSARAICAVLALAGSAEANAATFNWDPAGNLSNSGGGGIWDLTSPFWNDDNVSPNVVWPNLTDSIAVFAGTGGTVTINTGTTGTGVTAGGLVFNVDGYNISSSGGANRLTLGGPAPTITVTNPTDTATISSVISDLSAAGFAKLGSGTLLLGGTAANTFTGAVSVQNGSLVLSKPESVDAVGAGGLVIQSNNTLDFGPAVVRLAANEQINNAGAIVLNANGGNIAQLDLNEFTESIGALSMSSNTVGSATISTGFSGVLKLTSDITLNNNRNATGNTGREVLITGTGSYSSVQPSGTLDLGGVVRTITVTTTNAPTVANSSATIETTIQNGGIIKAGNSGLILENNFNTFSGGITVTGGELIFKDDGALGDQANTILLNGGGLAYTSASTDWNPFSSRVINIGPNGGSIGGSRPIRINDDNQITGSGTLTRTGTGAVGLDISSANPGFTGNVVINSAVLELKHNQAIGTGTGQTITINGGQLSLAETGVSGATVLSQPITLNGGALAFNNRIGGTFAGNVNVTADSTISVKDFYQNANRGGAISGILSGNGVLTVTGATGTLVGGTPHYGSLLLTNGGNTFSGTLKIQSGAQVRASQGGKNSLGTATIELAGGALGLAPSVSAAGPTPGLFGRFYNTPKIGTVSAGVVGGFDFGAETPVAVRNDATIDYPGSVPNVPALNNASITALWTGVLQVTNGGSYSFFTRSDDGSSVYVDGQLVVANDFAQGATERTGAIALSPGFHSVVIKYAQGGGAGTMSVNYQGADTSDLKSLLGSVPNSLTNNGANLFAATALGNAINVTANSDLDLAAANATSSGALTFANGVGLRVTGVTGSETLTQTGSVTLDGTNTITAGVTLTAANGTTAGQNHQSAGADIVITGNIGEATAGSGFTKDGPRTLTLTGNNTFTGLVTVSGGTLVGNTKSLPTPILNNAKVVFDQAADGAITKELSGSGTFVKQGDGTLSVDSASSTFAGTTEVRRGTLTGTGSLGGNVAVYAGGSVAGTNGSTFTVGDLSLKPHGSADFRVGAPSTTPMIASSSLAGIGSHINIFSAGGLAAGTYRLVDYTGPALNTQQFAGFAVGTAPSGFYYGLQNNTSDTALDLVVETAGALNTWTGSTSNVWDTTAANWASGAFANGQQITFSDAGANRTITGGAVAPQKIVVNGTSGNDYTITNSIGGTLAGGLVKSGANTLRLTGANTFSGAISVNGGTLAVSVSTNANGLGAGAVSLDGGTLEIEGVASTAATGLLGRYYNSNTGLTTALDFTLPAVAAQVDHLVNFTFSQTAQPAGGAVGNDESTTNTSWRQFSTEWSGKVKISTEGNYAFFVGSDDGSRLFVDGKLLAVNDGGHGEIESGGGVYLTPGLHDIRMEYTQGGGGAAARLRYAGPGIPKQFIPSSFLFTPESGDVNGSSNAIPMGNTINVAGNSSVSLKGEQFTSAQVGLLNLTAGSTLNVTGGPGKQLRATNTFLEGGIITIETGANLHLGNVSDAGAAVTITKRGGERLVLDNYASGANASQLSAGTIFDVQAGTLVAIGSNVPGSTNPLGSAKIQLNGGSLLLDSKIGGVTFNNAVNVIKSGTIAAQPDNQTMTLGSGFNGISIASGMTVTLDAFGGSRGTFGGLGGQTSAGATINVVGAISGAGNVTVQSTPMNGGQSPIPGTVIFAGANSYTGLTQIKGLPQGQTQVELRGNATLQSTTGVNEAGRLALTNVRLNLNNNFNGTETDRIPDAWPIEMNHGTLRFDGFSGGESSETVGAIKLKSGENNLFSGTTSATNTTTLTAASLTREGRSTLRVVGNNLGNGALNTNRIMFTDSAGITTALVGGGGFNGSTNASILPWAYADQNTFVTYDFDGLRRLNMSEYASYDVATDIDNVRSAINTNLAITGKKVNAYIVDNSATDATKTVTLTGTMNITSGALLLVGSASSNQKGVTIAPDASGGIINFGAAEGVITVNRAASTITAQVSGTNGLTVTGDSQLLLNNTFNDFSGQITINGSSSPITGASSLAAQNDLSLGDFDNDLVLNGGGFRFNSAFSLNLSREITIGVAGGSFDTGGGNSTIEGQISGPGDLIKVGGNTLTLTNTGNNYTGKTYVMNGQLVSSVLPAGDIETHGTYNFNLNDDATYGGTITGTGAITKSGFGTLTLTGANSHVQGTNVTQGTLKGTTSNLQNSINISSGASVVLEQATDGTFTGIFSGAGSVSKNGTSTITLVNSSNHSGGTLINAGTLKTANGASLGSGSVIIADAKLQITGSTDSGASITVASNNSILQVDTGSTFTIAGVKSDFNTVGTLKKTGGGTLEVLAPGDFSGSVDLAEGRIVMDDFTGLGTSTTTLAGHAVLSLRGQQNLTGFGGFATNGSAIASDDVLTLTANGGNQAGSAFFSGQRDLSRGFAMSFTYQASGGNGTLKADGFTFTLQNDFRGTTALGGTGGALGYSGITSSGAVAFNLYTGAGAPVGTALRTNGAGTSTYAPSAVNFANGGLMDITLVYDPATQTLTETITDQANPTAPYTNTFTGVDLASLLGSNSGYLGFTGATGGQTATQTLENFNFSLMGTSSLATFTNTLIVPNGASPTIEVAAATHGNNAALSGGMTLGSNSTLNVTGSGLASNSAYSLKVNESTAIGGAATVNVSNNGTGIGTLLLAGGISGSSMLTKSGDGRLSVAGNNSTTFTGDITLTRGSLHLADSNLSASAVLAQLGTELLGTGTLASLAGDGTTISPSSSSSDAGTGKLTFTGNLSLTSTSTLKLELGKALSDGQPVATDFDSITVGGNLVLNGSQLELSIANNGIEKDDIFTIILNNGSSAVSGLFAGLPNGALFSAGGQVFQISYFDNAGTPGVFEVSGGNDISLLAIPEPASVGTLVAGIGMLLGVRRFRRSKQ